MIPAKPSMMATRMKNPAKWSEIQASDGEKHQLMYLTELVQEGRSNFKMWGEEIVFLVNCRARMAELVQ